MTLPRTPPKTRSRTALRDTLPSNTDSTTTAESTNIIADPSAATNTAPSLEDQLLEAQERIAFAATELQKEIDRRVSFETELACLRAQQSNLAKPRKPDSFSGSQPWLDRIMLKNVLNFHSIT